MGPRAKIAYGNVYYYYRRYSIITLCLAAECPAWKPGPTIPLTSSPLLLSAEGLPGATLAAQLVRNTDPSFSVVVIERTGLPGRGVAYSTECNSHLLNVPAKDMSAFPEDGEHFLRWAKSNYDWKT